MKKKSKVYCTHTPFLGVRNQNFKIILVLCSVFVCIIAQLVAQNPILMSTDTSIQVPNTIGSNVYFKDGKYGFGTKNPNQFLTLKGISYWSPGNPPTIPAGMIEPIEVSIRTENWASLDGPANTVHIWDTRNTGYRYELKYVNFNYVPFQIRANNKQIRIQNILQIRNDQFNNRIIELKSDSIQNGITWTDNLSDSTAFVIGYQQGMNSVQNYFRILPNGQVQLGEHNIYKNYISGSTNKDNSIRFSVNGGIVAKNYIATIQNWADWVFDPTTVNPTLDEEKLSILKNKTLVGVPSASEVKNGRDLAENDALLLSKIEQNYLHDIQQEEKIKELENEILELKKQIQLLLNK